MNQSILIRRIVVAVIVAGMLGLLACEGGDPPVIVASEDPPADPDIVTEYDGIKGKVYTSGNPFHEHTADRWLGRAEVVETIATFERRGYTVSPLRGFTVETRDGAVSTTVTFLEMDGAGTSGNRSVLIACYGSGGETGVSAAEFSTREPRGEPGWRTIGELGWIRTGGDTIERSTAMFDTFSWAFFWDCMKVNAPGMIGGCSFACIFVGPGYWQCMLLCITTQAAGQAVSCIVKTLQSGATDIKEDPR